LGAFPFFALRAKNAPRRKPGFTLVSFLPAAKKDTAPIPCATGVIKNMIWNFYRKVEQVNLSEFLTAKSKKSKKLKKFFYSLLFLFGAWYLCITRLFESLV
jgi:hypothetical protein